MFIETGRYNNTPVDERICPFCNSNAIVMHFVTQCFLYYDLRISSYDNSSRIIDILEIITMIFAKYGSQFIENSSLDEVH